jgi:hypothetical protein
MDGIGYARAFVYSLIHCTLKNSESLIYEIGI